MKMTPAPNLPPHIPTAESSAAKQQVLAGIAAEEVSELD